MIRRFCVTRLLVNLIYSNLSWWFVSLISSHEKIIINNKHKLLRAGCLGRGSLVIIWADEVGSKTSLFIRSTGSTKTAHRKTPMTAIVIHRIEADVQPKPKPKPK